jgi:hypothetical protein
MSDVPTVARYIDWARDCGCVVGVEPLVRGGQSLSAVSIWAPSGRGALEIVLELDDPLMSTTIARLDRRLGLKSSLFS